MLRTRGGQCETPCRARIGHRVVTHAMWTELEGDRLLGRKEPRGCVRTSPWLACACPVSSARPIRAYPLHHGEHGRRDGGSDRAKQAPLIALQRGRYDTGDGAACDVRETRQERRRRLVVQGAGRGMLEGQRLT